MSRFLNRLIGTMVAKLLEMKAFDDIGRANGRRDLDASEAAANPLIDEHRLAFPRSGTMIAKRDPPETRPSQMEGDAHGRNGLTISICPSSWTELLQLLVLRG
ncbi:MAG: hypothetical protein KDA71_22480 [Planctomycetales bacterium]|nr:hypothetical protein [Planctomycetales bacterium]